MNLLTVLLSYLKRVPWPRNRLSHHVEKDSSVSLDMLIHTLQPLRIICHHKRDINTALDGQAGIEKLCHEVRTET